MAHQVLPTPRVVCPGTSLLLFFFPLFSKDRSQNIPTIWRVYLDSGNVMTCHAGGGPIHFVSFEAMVLRRRRQRDVPDGSLWGSCIVPHCTAMYTRWVLALLLFQRIEIALQY